MTSRRTFVAQASLIGAAGFVSRLPRRDLWRLTPRELLNEPDERLLRTLALAAIDAARVAGATFADIRMASGRDFGLSCLYLPQATGTNANRATPAGMSRTDGYGVRAIVDGAWGFVGATEFTLDAVVQAARTAVTLARANRSRLGRRIELAPAPPVPDGEWTTPMERDPLTVTYDELRTIGLAALDAMPKDHVSQGSVDFFWRRPTTVFASTEGTFIVQRHCQGGAGAAVYCGDDDHYAWDSIGKGGGYGYEAVALAKLPGAAREMALRGVARYHASRNPQPAEVGRYDIVFGAEAVGRLLTSTISEAVNLDRVLGYQANDEGTSFAAPPDQMLGRLRLASDLVTVRADRTRAHGSGTVGWDEEGVKPEEYTVIRDGRLVDYHTNRQAAVALTAWYESQGMPVRSHGCSRRTGRAYPTVLSPNLTLEPGKGSTTLEDLVSSTKRGFYIEDANGTGDQQVLNIFGYTQAYQVRRITNGKLGRYVRDLAFQFLTPQFWRSVDGLGGAHTSDVVGAFVDRVSVSDPLQLSQLSTVQTVPMRARQVNVLNTGRTA